MQVSSTNACRKGGRRAAGMGKWPLAANQWQDGVAMKNPKPHRWRAKASLVCLLLGTAATLSLTESQVEAAPVPLTQSDLELDIFASDGSSWHQLTAGTLAGYFGAHRCSCPVTISPIVGLTSSGKATLSAAGNSNSTIAVNFLLGKNCLAASASCTSVGQVSFSGTQSVASPTFDSSLVFQTASGSAAVACGSLTAVSTTLWAVLAQDGVALSFALSIDLPIITTKVAAPTAVTALTSNEGLLVTWASPADPSLVAGYQVLCLPGPAAASTAGYESCGLDASGVGSSMLTPADTTQLCSAPLPATPTQVRLSGLVNGTTYTVAVIAIDPSGGVSAVSQPAVATPGPTVGFYDDYKQVGGAATGCALSPMPPSGRSRLFWMALAALLTARPGRRWRRRRCRRLAGLASAAFVVLASGATARAQIVPGRSTDTWAMNPGVAGNELPPDWGLELGISLYRPAVDSEFGNGIHPYADTFGSSRHLMSEVELDRYLGHGFGSWGVGLRIGYQKVTGTAFQSDGISRSGDETSLRLVPVSVSALYKADGLPGLRSVPMVPYAKAGLDGTVWTENTTGGHPSHDGFTPGWHLAVGLALGLNSLGLGAVKQGAVAGPGSLFFEWDYAAINGLGLGSGLHVGDSTWFAGLMFDL